MTCDDEGAQLFYPKEIGEWVVVKNLSSMLTEAPNITDVLIGIHDETGFGEFVTVDGYPTPSPLNVGDDSLTPTGDCVIMDLQTGVYKTEPCTSDPQPKLLFACKKVDEHPCPTIDLAYKFSKESKKCYKISKREKTWNDAWHTCFMEGGLLFLPENYAEAKIMYDMLRDSDKRYFAGFHRIYPGSDFFSIKGKKLEELAYNAWYDRSNEEKEDCGVVYRYSNILYYRTRACHDRLPFICEMKARIFI